MPVENSEKISENREIENKAVRESKNWLVFLISGVIGILGGVGCILMEILTPKPEIPELEFPKIPSEKAENGVVYSNLTGLPLADASLINAPTYCVQTPNGLDGARPQAGLNEAGVIFEAIAEAGITRFAAIYQNPDTAVIGPIRSLRLYYLQWDTPFNCTIVHAGGSDDALAAVRSGGYRDLTENYSYMYRSSAGNRLWNNLFTTSADLAKFNSDRGFTSSEVNGFTRMTPEVAARARVDQTVAEKLVITEPATGNTSVMTPTATSIALNFGSSSTYNVRYNYDAATNSYLRAYASGAAHEVYDCPNENLGRKSPESVCQLTQMAPTVVVAMMVDEKKAADRYHEDITTIGSGAAYIFQNGVAIVGSWSKPSVADQIRFYNESGEEIALVPGQTFVSAVPKYGSVAY